MLITRDEAKAIVTPDIAALLAFLTISSVTDWPKEVSDSGRLSSSPSVRSHWISDRMVWYAQTKFHDSKDIKLVRKHGRYQILVKDKVIFKLKKIGRHNMMPSNIPTDTVVRFNSQCKDLPLNQQIPFPGFEPDDIAHLINGYVENPHKTEFTPCICCPNGNRPAWIWPLEFTPQFASGSLPLPNDEGSNNTRKRRVTPKPPTGYQTPGQDTKHESK